MLLLRYTTLLSVLLMVDHCCATCKIKWDSSLYVEPGDQREVKVFVSNSSYLPVDIWLNSTSSKSSNGSQPVKFQYYNQLTNETSNLVFHGVVTGENTVKVSTHNHSQCELSKKIIHVHVVRSYNLITIGDILGWLCLISWGISSYPQVILHFQLRSVAGYSINALWLNIIGYSCYCLYNIGMFWIPAVQEAYTGRYKNSENPVLLPDVIMTLHGIFIISVLSIQCVVFDRGTQKISVLSKLVGIVTLTEAFITIFITKFTDKMDWYQYVAYLSYIKLGITCIKYSPQVYLNYKRKSTHGFSIIGVVLDFVGALASLLQLLFEAGNSREWDLILADMTKFGLSLLTISFDVILGIQHFFIYKRTDKDNSLSETSPLLNPNNPVNT